MSAHDAAKFTPGPWKWWTSNSWRRLKRDDHGIRQNVLEPFVAIDGHPDMSVSAADMALIAAAPDLYAALRDLLDNPHNYNAMARAASVLAMVEAERG